MGIFVSNIHVLALFLGKYNVTVDDRKRISLPADFVSESFPGGGGDTFVLLQGIEKCILMYELSDFLPYYDELSNFNRLDEDERRLRRGILASIQRVNKDSKNRLLISQELLDYAEISEKDVVVMAAQGKTVMELWKKELYDSEVLGIKQVLSDLSNKIAKRKRIADKRND
ncbi:MAG: hypothetical protein EBX41_01100 [Chitinophagia bacterium]|nr:hypothetical protein [Chitinophagia bacterium]